MLYEDFTEKLLELEDINIEEIDDCMHRLFFKLCIKSQMV